MPGEDGAGGVVFYPAGPFCVMAWRDDARHVLNGLHV